MTGALLVGCLTAIQVIAVQGGWAGALAVPLVALGWRWAWARHGLGSLAAGGAGMALGALVDGWLGQPACHGGGTLLSFGTLGMALGCVLGCVAACRAGGARGLDLRMHGLAFLGMLGGEQVALAGAALASVAAGHAVATAGMAIGTALGAAVAGALRRRPTG